MKTLLSLTMVVMTVAASSAQERAFDSPYYPLKVGNRWTYAAGEQKVVVQVDQQEAMKVKRTDPKGKELVLEVLVSRLKVSSGDRELTEHVGVLEDGVYRFKAAGKEISPPLRFFKLPVQVGESWKCDSISESTILKGSFTSREEKIQVPAGVFTTRTAASKDFQVGTMGMAVEYWFAPNVGVVKTKIQVGNINTTLELEKFEPGK